MASAVSFISLLIGLVIGAFYLLLWLRGAWRILCFVVLKATEACGWLIFSRRWNKIAADIAQRRQRIAEFISLADRLHARAQQRKRRLAFRPGR